MSFKKNECYHKESCLVKEKSSHQQHKSSTCIFSQHFPLTKITRKLITKLKENPSYIIEPVLQPAPIPPP